MFSTYTVFYFRSISLTKTAIFFGILVFLPVANKMLLALLILPDELDPPCAPLLEGRWRVNVKTPQGLLLGRITFRITEADEADKAP